MTSEYNKNKKMIDNNFTEFVDSIIEVPIKNTSEYYLNMHEEKYKDLKKNNKIYENKINCLEETMKYSGETMKNLQSLIEQFVKNTTNEIEKLNNSISEIKLLERHIVDRELAG